MSARRRLHLACVIFLLHVLAKGSRSQTCTAEEFSINYDGETVLAVSRHNRTCSCPAFSGNGTWLSLDANPALRSLNQAVSAVQADVLTDRAAIAVAQGNLSQVATRLAALERTTIMNGTFLIAAASPPLPCSSSNTGFMWFSTVEGSAMLCNGNDWVVLHPYGSQGNPARSCFSLQLRSPDTAVSGMYWLDGDGPSGPVPPFQALCDMITDGGGWTVVWIQAGGVAVGDFPWTETRYNSLEFGPFESRYKIRFSELQSLPQSEHIIYRSRSRWIKVTGGFFSTDQYPSHQHELTGAQSATGERLQVLLGHSNTANSFGGWYVVAYGNIDHHSGSYYELNSGCSNDLVYVYGTNYFESNYGLGGGWPASGCGSGMPTATSVAIRGNSIDETFRNCRELQVAWRSAPSGIYWLDPDGPGGIAPFQAYCEMSHDGGGWTVVWSAMAGQTQEVPFGSSTINNKYNPYTVPYKLSLAQIQSLQQTEHVIWRSGGVWLKVGGRFFSTSQWAAHTHESVSVRDASGASNTAVLAHSPIMNSNGGWYAVSLGNPDHHSSTYYDLNSGCSNDYVYVYFSNMFYSNLALGSWPSLGCTSTSTAQLLTVIMVRGPVYSPQTTCKGLRATYGDMRSGYHSIDPDGVGVGIAPFDMFCEASLDGGGWTMVYQGAPDAASTSLGYMANTATLLSGATEVLFAYWNPTSYKLSSTWKFPIPTAFRSTAPMSGVNCQYATVNATNLRSGLSYTNVVLRYGYGGSDGRCDGACTGTAGQICLKSSATPLAPGGVGDFPMYTGFGSSAADSCSTSSGSATMKCSSGLVFVIFVR